MPSQDFTKEIEQIEARIAATAPEKRVELQGELHKLVQRISAAGVSVPARLHDLDVALTEEAVEAQFDNLPV